MFILYACMQAHAWPYREREGVRQEKSGESGENHIEPARRAARRTAGSRGRVNWPQLPFSKVLSKIQNSRLGGRQFGSAPEIPGIGGLQLLSIFLFFLVLMTFSFSFFGTRFQRLSRLHWRACNRGGKRGSHQGFCFTRRRKLYRAESLAWARCYLDPCRRRCSVQCLPRKIRATVCLIQYLSVYWIPFHRSGSVLDSSSRDLQEQTS